jgi:hypothetical protein
MNTVVGALEDILNTYGNDDGNTTVADLLANVLTDKLSNIRVANKQGILSSPVSVTYYEHTN